MQNQTVSSMWTLLEAQKIQNGCDEHTISINLGKYIISLYTGDNYYNYKMVKNSKDTQI